MSKTDLSEIQITFVQFQTASCVLLLDLCSEMSTIQTIKQDKFK